MGTGPCVFMFYVLRFAVLRLGACNAERFGFVTKMQYAIPQYQALRFVGNSNRQYRLVRQFLFLGQMRTEFEDAHKQHSPGGAQTVS